MTLLELSLSILPLMSCKLSFEWLHDLQSVSNCWHHVQHTGLSAVGTAVYHKVLLRAFCVTDKVVETGDRLDRAWRFFSFKLKRSYNNMKWWARRVSVLRRGWCRQEKANRREKGLGPGETEKALTLAFCFIFNFWHCSPSSHQLTPGGPGS